MDEKSSNQKNENVQPLPPDNHAFWRGAEKNTFTLGDAVTCKKQHFFVRSVGSEVVCKYCPIGHILTPEYEVRNGRILLHGTIVV